MSIRVLGGQRELEPKHQFLVYVDGFMEDMTGFNKCSELSVENAEITYWEGGSTIPWKMPGRQTYTDITLEQGTSSDEDFYNWCLTVSNSAQGRFPTRGGGVVLSESGDWRRNATIVQLDRDGVTALKYWEVTNCWPKKLVVSDGWDATTDEVVMQSLTLAMDYFELGR
jgi:phage tail-like protein